MLGQSLTGFLAHFSFSSVICIHFILFFLHELAFPVSPWFPPLCPRASLGQPSETTYYSHFQFKNFREGNLIGPVWEKYPPLIQSVGQGNSVPFTEWLPRLALREGQGKSRASLVGWEDSVKGVHERDKPGFRFLDQLT